MPEILTRREAAALLRVTPRTLDKLVRAGRIPATCITGEQREHIRIRRVDIERLFDQPKVAVT